MLATRREIVVSYHRIIDGFVSIMLYYTLSSSHFMCIRFLVYDSVICYLACNICGRIRYICFSKSHICMFVLRYLFSSV